MFERVYVINLKRRPDRLMLFMKRLETYGWPFKKPIVYPAIDGDKVGVPPEFTQGGGAYGCRMSHLRILQDCLMEDVSSVLILEDDADTVPSLNGSESSPARGFSEMVLEFLAKVPDDWDGIMLGGQHHAPPFPTGIPGVVRVRYAQRTHAYAARPSYMKALQRRWGNCTVHIDWMMRDWQHQYRVYAPDPWLIGQAGGRSDIRGDEKPPEWWVRTGSIRNYGPVAVAVVDRPVMDEMRKMGFHDGFTRDDDGIDVGLKRIFSGERADTTELKRWLERIETECVGGMIPTVWHPKATTEIVKSAWPGPVHEVRGTTAEEAFSALPSDIQRMMKELLSLKRAPIVLLRCPASMISELPSAGFHPGHWRHRERQYDNGLIRICEELPEQDRIPELQKWCKLLCQEADRDGMVVAAVHPLLTADMLRRSTSRCVIEIQARTVQEIPEKIASALA